MKKVLSFFGLLLLAVTALAQSPKLSYQAVVRDNQNKLVVDKLVIVEVNILDSNNNTKFSQDLSAKTNSNGLLSLEIGEETDNWKTIEWKGAKIRTAVTLAGGTVVVDTTAVNAVPMALYASRVSDEALAKYLDSSSVISRLQDSLAVRDSIIEKLKTAIVDSIVPKINEIISYVNHYHTSHVVTDGVTNNGGTSVISGSGSTSSDSFICGDSLVTDAQGNTYHTVELKSGLLYTCWMAENLRTQIEGDYGYPIGCVTAEDSLKAGRLYSHTIAVGETSALNGSGVRGICPEGWYIPSKQDFSNAQNLNAFLSGQYIGPDLGISSSYSDYGTKAYFWTSTLVLDDNSLGHAWEVPTEDTTKILSKANGLSVRCLKDGYTSKYQSINYDSPISPILPGVGPIAF